MILGFSAVTNVNLEFIPKTSKGLKVRYEGWAGFESKC